MKKLVVILYLLSSITMQAKEIKENRIFKKVKKTEIVKQVKPLKTIQLKWGLWDAILDIADWLTSPFRPVWGDYVEDGMRVGNPWPKTMFPRSVNDDVPAMVNTIREKVIIVNSFENNLYYNIYTSAQQPLPGLSGSGFIANETGVSSNFIIGKNAAFVYWLGINKTGDTLSAGARQSYLNKVKSGMWSWADSKAGSFSGKGNQVYRAKENIMLMQAYNFLEMAKQENAALFPPLAQARIQ